MCLQQEIWAACWMLLKEGSYLKGAEPVAGLLWRNSDDHRAFLQTEWHENVSYVALCWHSQRSNFWKTYCVIFIHKCANVVLKGDGALQKVLLKHGLQMIELILDRFLQESEWDRRSKSPQGYGNHTESQSEPRSTRVTNIYVLTAFDCSSMKRFLRLDTCSASSSVTALYLVKSLYASCNKEHCHEVVIQSRD